jgi:hypothetical protein
MTRHQTEGAVYAGQAHMGGAEGMDRATFKKVSEIFNAFVYEPSPVPAPPPVQAPNERTGRPAPVPGEDQLAPPELSSVYGSIQHIDAAGIDWDEEYKELCLLDSGRDLREMTPAHTAAVNETPRTNARHHPTSFSSTKAEVLATLKRNQICLLHQKPGFGKTRIIMELLSKNSFLIIFVPTKVLRAQVTAISYTNHFCHSQHDTYTGNQGHT